MFDLLQRYKAYLLQVPVTKTSTFTGAATQVDAGINEDLVATAIVGAAATAVGDTAVITIEGSPDNSSWSTAATIPGTALGNGGGNEIAQVAFKRGLNRYFRAKITIVSASSPSFQYTVLLQAGAAQRTGASLNSGSLV